MPYRIAKVLIAVAFAGALAFSSLSGRSWYSVTIVIVIGLALLGWIASHRAEVMLAHEERMRRGEEYMRESGRRGQRPKPAIGVALLALCGAGMIAATYADPAQADVRGLLRQLLYSFLGPTLTIIMAAGFAATFLMMTLELGLGAYWTRPNKSLERTREG
jgi:hypothetical protein